MRSQPDLLEDDGLLLPHGVDGVAGRRPGLEGFPLGVHREAEHVDLHVRPHLLIGEELARNDLEGREGERERE